MRRKISPPHPEKGTWGVEIESGQKKYECYFDESKELPYTLYKYYYDYEKHIPILRRKLIGKYSTWENVILCLDSF